MPAPAVRFTRVALVVCDSAAVGCAPDAAEFGDEGTHTVGHVIEAAAPSLPHLSRLGLGNLPGVALPAPAEPEGCFGRLTERGPGKDTMLGHWELMGVIARDRSPLYPGGFPSDVVAMLAELHPRGILGNRAASGTAIIEELGAEHVRTGRLIVYTSGDSVLQIAAHEQVVPVDALYRICQQTRERMVGPHAVGRVIARPFVGSGPGDYRRTGGRRDFPLPPPAPTALDILAGAGIDTLAVGKIRDIFAGSGIADAIKTADNAAGIDATIRALRSPGPELIFTNLVDFDTDYGHRNDPAGYAAALEAFDRRLPEIIAALPTGGCLILTADHGNDPTTPGTDHTRERVPLLIVGPTVAPRDLGDHDFADLGATLLENFGVTGDLDGRSFLAEIPRH